MTFLTTLPISILPYSVKQQNKTIFFRYPFSFEWPFNQDRAPNPQPWGEFCLVQAYFGTTFPVSVIHWRLGIWQISGQWASRRSLTMEWGEGMRGVRTLTKIDTERNKGMKPFSSAGCCTSGVTATPEPSWKWKSRKM